MRLRKSRRQNKLRSVNTSGYQGVSWHKAAGKWAARIRVKGRYRHLGLFNKPEEAHEAYKKVAAEINQEIDKANADLDIRNVLIDSVKQHYAAHGIKALSTPFLEKATL